MNPGYAMIDLTGLDLTLGSTEQTVNGLYAQLKKGIASGKEMVGFNAIWGTGVPMTPISFFAIEYSTTLIIATASTLQIYITNADKVTIVNMVGD